MGLQACQTLIFLTRVDLPSNLYSFQTMVKPSARRIHYRWPTIFHQTAKSITNQSWEMSNTETQVLIKLNKSRKKQLPTLRGRSTTIATAEDSTYQISSFQVDLHRQSKIKITNLKAKSFQYRAIITAKQWAAKRRLDWWGSLQELWATQEIILLQITATTSTIPVTNLMHHLKTINPIGWWLAIKRYHSRRSETLW